jgi:multiple sugar transport system substrate-binding protein
MRRRRILWISLALAVAAACTFTAASLARSQRHVATTTVTLSGWASSPVETSLLKQVIAGFQKANPTIKVNYAPINGDYPTAMLAKFAARTPPDVFYVDSNVIPDWIRQKVLEPLDSYIAQSHFDTGKFYPSLLNAFKGPDGHIYGLPKDWSPLAMETNNGMLGKAGVKIPKTWPELVAAAQKLKSSGAVSDGAPLCLSPDWARMLAFVYQNGGTFLNQAKTAATLTSAKVTQAVNFYVSFVKGGYAKTPQQLGVGWCGEALGKQKTAIIFEGNWLVPYMHDTFPGTGYGISPLPKGSYNGNLAFTVSYSMGHDSKNKPAAWKLISYLTGQKGMATWTSKGLALPSRSDVAPPGGRKAFLSQAAYSHPWQFAPTFSKVIDVANNELTAVFAGSESVPEMLKKVQDAANAALH